MKYRVLSLFIAISIVSIANASVPIVIPSGQQLWFDLTGYDNHPELNHADIVAPATSWNGFTKPGGNIIIPDTIIYNGVKYPVTRIIDEAFKNCNSITSVVIPHTVETIGQSAFSGCTSLHTLTIGTGVKRMATYMQYSSWTSVSILSNCTSLDTIYYNADSCYMGYMFGGGAIGQHTAVVIGDNVKYIPASMFRNLYPNLMPHSIESVVVGSSVSNIAGSAFRDCSDLKTVTFRSQNPPFLGGYAFDGVNTDSVTCYVPCGRTSAYYNQWSTLFNYTEASASYSLIVSSNYDSWGTAEVIQQPSCDGNATIGATASCGYYFVRWSDGNTDNPRTLTLQNDTYLTAIFASSYNVPDTVFVHDTTTVNNYVHDTTYLPIYLHDTVPMIEYLHDTIYLPQYIHDTTIVNQYFHDTIYLPQYFHDTTFVLVHDTSYINVHDTTYIMQTDTVTNMVYDTITNTVFDTITNTVYDTTIVYSTDTLWLHDTVFVHDTIFIFDTIYVGVDEVETVNAKIYTSNGQIVVDGAERNTVWIYDVNGRVLATKQDEYSPLHFNVPASGAYMVKIGRHPARKIVVVR